MSPTFISTSSAIVIVAVLAKATLLLVAALAAAAVLRRAAAGARHLVWLAVLASVLVLPIIARWAPFRLEVLPPETDNARVLAGIDAVSSPAPNALQVQATSQQPQSRPGAQQSQVGRAVEEPRQATSSEHRAWSDISWWTLALGAWLTVAAGLLAWLGYGAWSVRRIVRDGEPLTDPRWTDALYEAADRLDLEQSPRLLSSNRVEMPFACGLLRPTIVLPASSAQWSDDLRRTVLFHELAHVRRRDLVGHTVGRFACALYWFHPLVWTAAKRLRAESERACDDLVLSCGAKASDYAEHLLRMVIGVRHYGAPALAMPMARRKEFEGRMVAILDPAIRRQAPQRWQAAGLVGVLAVLCLTLGAVAPAARKASESSRRIIAGGTPSIVDTTPVSSKSDAPQHVELPRKNDVASRTDTRTETRTDTRTETRTSTATASPTPTPTNSASPSPSPSAEVSRAIGDVAKYFTNRALSTLMQRGDTTPDGMSSRDKVSLLMKLARTDEDASVRKTAVWALADARNGKRASGDADIEETLIDVLRSDDDDDVREMAAWALEQFGGDATIAALKSAARRDKSADVRETAIWALGSKEAAGSMELFEAAMSDESHDVRATAIWAIGTLEPKRAPPGLVKALDDEDEDVRLRAAWALGQIVDPSTGDALVAAFKREQKSDVRSAELRALAFLGEQSKSVLDAALSSSDADLRARAVQILAGRGAGVWPWPWPNPRPRPSP